MLKKILLAVAIVLAGWLLAVFVIPWHRNEERPRDVLTRFFTALNAGDEDAALKTFTKDRQEYLRKDPAKFSQELAWDRLHPIDFQIISDTSDGTVGYVTYRIRREWGHGVKDTIIKSQ